MLTDYTRTDLKDRMTNGKFFYKKYDKSCRKIDKPNQTSQSYVPYRYYYYGVVKKKVHPYI